MLGDGDTGGDVADLDHAGERLVRNKAGVVIGELDTGHNRVNSCGLHRPVVGKAFAGAPSARM